MTAAVYFFVFNVQIYLYRTELRMITITKIQTINEAEYNYVHCPQCNNKIGWKHKGSKVHIFGLSQRAAGRMAPMGLTCKRCKSHYLITTETE